MQMADVINRLQSRIGLALSPNFVFGVVAPSCSSSIARTSLQCANAAKLWCMELRHDRSVEERTEEGHFRLAIHLHAEQAARQWRHHDDDVSELRRDDAASVVTRVLRPHDLHLVVAKVTQLKTVLIK